MTAEATKATIEGPSIFYAWQSDRDGNSCRYLIRDAAKQALKDLAIDLPVDESPRLDSDTTGTPGHPEIARTIFSKIDEAAIFLADLTFTGSSVTTDGRNKLLANSNVLLELGYASASLGWERIVLVMNSEHGKPDSLLFDILHRRHPISYSYVHSTKDAYRASCQSLAPHLKSAFKSCFAARHEKVAVLVRRLDSNCLWQLQAAGHATGFPGPQPNQFVLGAAPGRLDTPSLNSAISRMLDLDLIHSGFVNGQNFYYWTYWGKEVARALGFRK